MSSFKINGKSGKESLIKPPFHNFYKDKMSALKKIKEKEEESRVAADAQHIIDHVKKFIEEDEDEVLKQDLQDAKELATSISNPLRRINLLEQIAKLSRRLGFWDLAYQATKDIPDSDQTTRTIKCDELTRIIIEFVEFAHSEADGDPKKFWDGFSAAEKAAHDLITYKYKPAYPIIEEFIKLAQLIKYPDDRIAKQLLSELLWSIKNEISNHLRKE
jgi:hypothetical protein